MQLVYKGSNAAINFNVNGVDIRLQPGKSVDITDKQVTALKARAYVQALVEKGLLVFTDVQEQVYCIYQTYEDLLNSVTIRGLSIEEIIDKHLYEDLTIF